MKIALIIATLATPTHEFYSQQCCEGLHCHPVPCEEITSTVDGWMWNGTRFELRMLRMAPDGNCHICIAPNFLEGKAVDKPTCIYLPPRT